MNVLSDGGGENYIVLHPSRGDSVNDRILLGILESLERDASQSQRKLAASLGIALGLVNAYLRRCVKKGLIKIRDVPTRRCAYYITPKGFAEKSRLTVEYLSLSFSFFRRAKSDCARVLDQARENGLRHMVLAGKSDLAEIAILCAVDSGISIVALVESNVEPGRFIGIDLVRSYADVREPFDSVMITNLTGAAEARDIAVAACGTKPVFAPALLGLSSEPTMGVNA